MSDLKFRGLALVVRDLDISEVFYSDVLGLSVTSKREGHIIYDGLELYSLARWTEELEKNVMDYVYGMSTHSLVFSTYTFDSILDRIYKTEWINIVVGVKKDKGLRIIRIADPDGNIVTIREEVDKYLKLHWQETIELGLEDTSPLNSFVFLGKNEDE